MPSDAAELSSIVGILTDLEGRLEAMAHRYTGTEREDLLAALYEAERSVRAARRQVERAERLAE